MEELRLLAQSQNNEKVVQDLTTVTETMTDVTENILHIGTYVGFGLVAVGLIMLIIFIATKKMNEAKLKISLIISGMGALTATALTLIKPLLYFDVFSDNTGLFKMFVIVMGVIGFVVLACIAFENLLFPNNKQGE